MKPASLQPLTISANFAISADGKISSSDCRPSGWTSREDHQRLLDLRRGADAILVGRRTLLADNMTLTVPGAVKHPLRCVASASGKFTGQEKLFHTAGGEIHLWSQETPTIARPDMIIHHGDVCEFLQTLHDHHGVKHLHCEGGGELLRLLIERDVLDEIHLTWAAHTIFGGAKAPTITGIPGMVLDVSRHFKLTHFDPRPANGEVFLSYRRAGNLTQ